jgi:hypothetical protein
MPGHTTGHDGICGQFYYSMSQRIHEKWLHGGEETLAVSHLTGHNYPYPNGSLLLWLGNTNTVSLSRLLITTVNT